MTDLGRLFHAAVSARFMYKVRRLIHRAVHEHAVVISHAVRHHVLLVKRCAQYTPAQRKASQTSRLTQLINTPTSFGFCYGRPME